MNKTDLVNEVASRANVSKKDARAVVDAIFDPEQGLIADSLRRGDRVAVAGFGTFEIRERGPRVGRNPRTGEEMQIGPSRAPAFRAGKSLRDAMQKGK